MNFIPLTYKAENSYFFYQKNDINRGAMKLNNDYKLLNCLSTKQRIIRGLRILLKESFHHPKTTSKSRRIFLFKDISFSDILILIIF